MYGRFEIFHAAHGHYKYSTGKRRSAAVAPAQLSRQGGRQRLHRSALLERDRRGPGGPANAEARESSETRRRRRPLAIAVQTRRRVSVRENQAVLDNVQPRRNRHHARRPRVRRFRWEARGEKRCRHHDHTGRRRDSTTRHEHRNAPRGSGSAAHVVVQRAEGRRRRQPHREPDIRRESRAEDGPAQTIRPDGICGEPDARDDVYSK